LPLQKGSLCTRIAGGSGIFDGGGGNISAGGSGDDGGTDSNVGYWGTGTSGARLVLFSCSRLVWVLENAIQGLSFPHRWHLYSIKANLFLLLLFKCLLGLLEGLDDRFIIIGVVGVSGDCGM
jgi:hypothetical protein